MKIVNTLLVAAFFMSPTVLFAQDSANVVPFAIQPADDTDLATFKWTHRVVVVFADSPLDPSFSKQLELLSARSDALLERDIIVFSDTDPDQNSAMRTALRPRGFALVIVDKDGRVMLRKPSPWDTREITRAIDKTPLRQQELREAK